MVAQAKAAKEAGASRFCMGAAWRSPRDKDLVSVEEMVRQVKALGLETCMTLGMVDGEQATRLAAAGLDYYNHNLDTSPRLLRRNHHYPHLQRPPGDPGHRARRRYESVFRRHFRHG